MSDTLYSIIDDRHIEIAKSILNRDIDHKIENAILTHFNYKYVIGDWRSKNNSIVVDEGIVFAGLSHQPLSKQGLISLIDTLQEMLPKYDESIADYMEQHDKAFTEYVETTKGGMSK